MILLTPVTLHVAPLSRADTTVDALGGEAPARRVYGATIQIDAQWDDSARDRRNRGGGGAHVQHQASSVSRSKDAARLGWSPQIGDKLVKLVERNGTERTDTFYVVDSYFDGSWFQGASELVGMWGDEHPARKK